MRADHPQLFFIQRIRTTGFDGKLIQSAEVLFNVAEQPIQLSGIQAAGCSAADIADADIQAEFPNHLCADFNLVKKRIQIGLDQPPVTDLSR